MGKRKVEEDDDDYNWIAVPKKAYRVERPHAIATRRVKEEPLESDYIPSHAVQIAGPSRSTALPSALQASSQDGSAAVTGASKRSKRVEKEADEGPPPEKRLARQRKSCPKVRVTWLRWSMA